MQNRNSSSGDLAGRAVRGYTLSTLGITGGSSIRYKEHIQNISLTDNKFDILNLQPITFDYKEQYKHFSSQNSSQEIGLIAEDVMKNIPELVGLDEYGKPHMVNYSKLSIVLLVELQRMRKEINELKEQIASNG